MTNPPSGQIRNGLASEKIRAALPPDNLLAQQVNVLVLDETGSSNADLLAMVDRLTEPVILFAERQTAGRGRAGRTWFSQPENSLTFSLAWHFDLRMQDLLGLPLAVGVALAEALARLGVQVQLKWPNDVLKDGKKLAGILIESASGSAAGKQHGHWAIIGVGMNLRVPPELEAQIGQEVADAPWLAQLERNILAAHLCSALCLAMDEFARQGLGAFTDRWNQLHAYAGQEVVVLDQGQIQHQGRAIGLDQQGRLLIATEQGQVALLAGDVSLRPKHALQQGTQP